MTDTTTRHMPPLHDIATQAWRRVEPCGALVSYWDLRKATDVAAELEPWRAMGCRVFCDSGAFTAMSMKQAIDVADYRAWLLDHHELFTVYANLDVIGNDRATAKNQRTLEAAGLSPLPVFHVGESWATLRRMAKAYDQVALGGMVSFKRGANVGSWIAQAFREVDGRARLHGFGVTRWEFMRDFAWESVDSTTWVSGDKYGAQLVWLGSRLIQLDREALVRERAKVERVHGVTIERLINRGNADRRDLALRREASYRVGLQALALAQANRRRYVADYTIYCSGVNR